MKRFLFIACFFMFHSMQAVIIGSNSQCSIQPTALFPAADTNNTMRGFASFFNGVYLEDSTTTCLFDSFAPFSGPMLLNGGTLKLNQTFAPDLSTESINGGTIDGKGIFPIVYPSYSDALDFPSFGLLTGFCFQKSLAVTNTKNCTCLDVSYDDAYLAAALGTLTTSEIVLYSLASDHITPLLPVPAVGNIGSTVNDLRWHPNQNYLAVCCSNNATGKELCIYKKTVSGPLSKVSEVEMGADVLACAWHPTGNYLVVWKKGSTNQLRCYAFNSITGALSLVGVKTITNATTIAHSGLSFSPDGIYLAVGLPQSSSLSELMVFTFADGWLDLIVSNNVAATVESLSFDPTGAFIALALSGATSGSVCVYKFDNEINTLTFQTATQESRSAYDVRWDPSGTFVAMSSTGGAVGTAGALGTIQVYCFLHDIVLPAAGFPLPAVLPFFYSMTKTTPSTHKSLCWRHDATHFFVADSAMKIEDYVMLQKNFTVKDCTIEMGSDLKFVAPVEIEGTVKICSVKGKRTKFLMTSDGYLIIKSGATLILDGVDVEDCQESSIICQDGTATLVLRNSTLSLSGPYIFANGSLLIDGVSGLKVDVDAYTFHYTSQKSLTVAKDAAFTIGSHVIFNYQPSSARNNLIKLDEETSIISMEDSSTLSITSTSGLVLTKGQLVCNGDVTINSDLQSSGGPILEVGLCLGTGIAADNCSFIVMPIASVFVNGYFIDKNTAGEDFLLRDRSIFQLNAGSYFKTYISLVNPLGEFRRSSESTLLYGPGATITPEPTEF